MNRRRIFYLGQTAACCLFLAAVAHAQFLSSVDSTSSQNSAVITWTTSAPATTQVKYGTTTSYGSTSTLDRTLGETHVVNLTNLTPGTLYHFQALSADELGQSVATADQSFTTLTGPPPPPSPLAIDKVVFGDSPTVTDSIATSALTTSGPNELLLAFIGISASRTGQTVTGVTGGGLTWTLVTRTNAQMGTSEVWGAIAPSALKSAAVTATYSQPSGASITVVAFVGADLTKPIGATGSGNGSTGAPKGTLTTTRDGSWVFAAGNDYDNATSRTMGSGQTLIHQYLAPSKDTYWAQQQALTTSKAGTVVTMNDTAPTIDRFNLALVEVLPATTDSGPPPPPTHSVTLKWDAGVSGAKYDVLQSDTSGGPYTTIVTGLTSPTYVDKAVNSGEKLFYVVDQQTSTGTSGYSSEVEADIP